MSMLDPLPATPAAPMVLYDGDCGFCHRSIEFILKHELSPTLVFAPLKSDLGRAELLRQGWPADFYGSLVLIEDGRAYRYSTAVLRICRYLHRPWRWAWALRVLPVRVLDAVYRFVARNRYRLGGPGHACRLPPENTRTRFFV